MAGTLYLILLIVSFQFDSLLAEASFPVFSVGEQRDLCHGSKRFLTKPPSAIVDGSFKTHAPCIVC